MDELALLSLSSGDYSCIDSLARGLMDTLSPAKIGLSLPSLRVDSLSPQLMEQIKRVRKTGFTLAPEAGSERLRRLINKNLCQEDIIATSARAFALGWEHIKLYFMIGLPEETDEDIMAIADLCARIAACAPSSSRGGKALVNASIGLFVPKAQTPFQWEKQLHPEEARRRMRLAKAGVSHKRVKVKWNDPDVSIIEGVLSRGDRRLSRALEEAVALGCRFDGWSEHFRLPTWLEALERAGLKWEDYLSPRPLSAPVPWEHISMGVSREYLLRERRLAYNYEQSKDCRQGDCAFCGVCDGREITPRLVTENGRLASFPVSASRQKQTAEDARLVYRLLFSKTGPARFTGHLELISQITRSLRRSGLELAHSAGFHPHPLIKTAAALPLGVESMGEELEIILRKGYPPSRLPSLINPNLPRGLMIISARTARPGEVLREAEQAEYLISGAGELDPFCLERFQAADSVICLRQSPKGDKVIDLKTAVLGMELRSDGLRMTIKTAGARPRAAEVLETVFGLSREQAFGVRVIKQWPGSAPIKN
jgi:radical SAM-linked protein